MIIKIGLKMEFIIFSLVFLVSGFFWYAYYAPKKDKESIKRDLKKQGYKFLQMESMPNSTGNRENERNYSVLYQQPDGVLVLGKCKTSIATGVFWSSTKLHISDNMFDEVNTYCNKIPVYCIKCHKPLKKEWVACPICGKLRTI